MIRALKWIAGAAAILYILFTATPLADLYSAPLYTPADAQPSDVIVLMSSGPIGGEWVTPDAAQRTWGALKLYKARYAPFVISAGGVPQAATQAAMLKTGGVPPEAIALERSLTTHLSAVGVARIMGERGWRSAVVVTSEMDVPRVHGVFRKLGIATSFLPVPEFDKPQHFHFFRRAAFDISFHATYEYLGLVDYKWHGWI
jgi:uncharacterized SAM-binding protein YcdF (DUF218 family)